MTASGFNKFRLTPQWTWCGVIPLLLLFALPLALSLALFVPSLLDAQNFGALWQHPQFIGAVRLTLFTGLVSTLLSLLLSLVIIAKTRRSLSADAGAILALPHLSFVIGLAFLIMPAGVLARLLAMPLGWTTPPQWVTTQDPFGLALTVALVLKETPFLVWAFSTVLNRDDLQQLFAGHRRVAASLGYGRGETFRKVILPQIVPRVIWPLVAVLAYGLTVVDMTLVIGPTQPPTLAQLVWTDLNDADPAANGRGGAGVIVLSGLILSILMAVFLCLRSVMATVRNHWSQGTSPSRCVRNGSLPLQRRGVSTEAVPSPLERGDHRAAMVGEVPWLWTLLLSLYACVALVLIIQSFAGLWPFPNVLPDQLTLSAWFRLLANLSPVATSLLLAILTSLLALAAAVVWLETQAPSNDTYLLWLAALTLCLPALVIGLGQYRLFLQLGITGTAPALFFAHVLPVSAYVIIMLQGPYQSFDYRYRAVAFGLRASRARFLISIKWPMLKAALLSAFAVGFAVSMAQFVPAQLAAAGRFTTLPMEAVTLTSGGNRALTAAYGLALMALPLLVFVGTGLASRPRWRNT